ncbi:peptidyl-prolyl cis-trans isomerase [Candidatus Pacearchaeota archaeon]|nr:peptidyl-prolyl cis-trans isomerase [Candidatus Pacearchaeota archaeon]
MTSKINASHILVKTETEALALLTYLKNGKSFEELARERSLCPSGKKGGCLGWFGRGQMVKEFENASFSGKKGEIVGPIKTQFGWHIIKIVDSQ